MKGYALIGWRNYEPAQPLACKLGDRWCVLTPPHRMAHGLPRRADTVLPLLGGTMERKLIRKIPCPFNDPNCTTKVYDNGDVECVIYYPPEKEEEK